MSSDSKVVGVPSPARERAVEGYRRRLTARGLSRFEVMGRPEDRDLIRAPARRMAEDDAEAVRLRTELGRSLVAERPVESGILAALRRSPLVGADLDLRREEVAGRDVAL